MFRSHRSPVPLTAAWVAVGWTCAVLNLAGQSTPAPPSATDPHVSATIEGLENIKLLEKGISAGGTADSLSNANLLSGASLDQKMEAPLAQPTSSRDESALRELQREQWARENWLVEGLRREALAGDEAALTADTLLQDPESAADESVGGSSAYWLAVAVNTQEETQRFSSEASAAEAHGVEAEQGISSAANPLGDFMAEWLSDSSQALLAANGDSGSSRGEASSFGQLATDSVRSTGGDGFRANFEALAGTFRTGSGSATTSENPFLAAIDQDLASVRLPRDNQPAFDPIGPFSPDAGVVPPLAQSAGDLTSPTVLPPATPAATPAVESTEPYRPPAKEDEKYFPRLKRF